MLFGRISRSSMICMKSYYQNTGEKQMNENAERINGLAAMLGVVAAMGAYALTGQIIPGIW